MKCFCGQKTAVKVTQKDVTGQKLPNLYKDRHIIRRRYLCEANHSYWTIEVLEKLWQEKTGEGVKKNVEMQDVSGGNSEGAISGSGGDANA